MRRSYCSGIAAAFVPCMVILLGIAGCGTAPSLVNIDASRVHFVPLTQSVNSGEDDFAGFIVQDKMYFTSNRIVSDTIKKNENIWVASLFGSTSPDVRNAGESFNSVFDEGTMVVASDGSTVFFTQCWAPNSLGDGDLYTATLDANGKLTRVRNLAEINTRYWESNPSISKDGSDLYFASDRPGGSGGTDIWVSHRLANGKWGAPVNLGKLVNTSEDEKAPYIAPDNQTLYYSSNGFRNSDGFDFYVTKRVMKNNKYQSWSAPEKLGAPFSSDGDDLFFRLTAEEDSIVIASSRDESIGGLDIFISPTNPFKDTSRYRTTLAIVVLDSITRNPIPSAGWSLRSQTRANSGVTDRYGRFNQAVDRGETYDIEANAKGYYPSSAQVAVSRTYTYREMRREILLPPVPKPPDTVASPVEHYPIVYFDFDKSDIRQEALQAIQTWIEKKLHAAIAAGDEFSILVDAYTDDYGTEHYNTALSKRRGDAVVRILKQLGVPLENILMTPHGESAPISTNETDEGRQLNRRVELRIEKTN